MYFIQGENMATKKTKEATVVDFKSFQKTIIGYVYDEETKTHERLKKYLKQLQGDKEYQNSHWTIGELTKERDKEAGIRITSVVTEAMSLLFKENHPDYYSTARDLFREISQRYAQRREPKPGEIYEGDIVKYSQLLLENSVRYIAKETLDNNLSIQKKTKANLLNKLQEPISEESCVAISNAFINYIDTIEKGQLTLAKEIDKIIPEGIELTPIKIEKVVPPYVDVKIPVPEPRIPLDPKIPIPDPRIPLDPKIPLPDPKIPIPRPEIKIPGPYYKIKDLEIKLAEVERIRKSLPKNATKAEKKAAANAEQQIKNLLKAAKRAEPKAAKKAVAKKATVKKSATKKK